MHATIFDIKHYAIHDGPGIRQTIFFKGCPLTCWWCHNPESRSSGIIEIEKEEDFNGKKVCSTEKVGRNISLEELITSVEKDRVFFEESGGGVTLSGGEPLMQFEFVYNFLRECINREIHTCLDTTGFVDEDKIVKISDVTRLFLYDIKHIDSRKHSYYSGTDNHRILNNLKKLDSLNKDIWLRIPLIPGINDDEGDLLRLMDMLSKLKNNHPVFILPYHKIGSHKYEKFGINYLMDNTEEPSEEYMVKVVDTFIKNGFKTVVGG